MENKTENIKSLLEIALSENIYVNNKCQGFGICGKCRIRATPRHNLSPLSRDEIETLTPEQILNSERLACQTYARGPVTLEAAEPERVVETSVPAKLVMPGPFSADAAVQRKTISKKRDPAHFPSSFSSMAQYLSSGNAIKGLPEPLFNGLSPLQQLARFQPHETDLTVVRHKKAGITTVLSGCRESSLGLAVDLGSTTVAAYLADLKKGEIVAAASKVNPQRRFGEDVITRITFVGNSIRNLEQLNRLAVGSVNELITACTEECGASPEDIDEVVIAGNTTMEQIFLNISPRLLGKSPFLPATHVFPVFTASQTGLDLNPAVPVTLFPVISGFVGGDALAAAAAMEINSKSETILIIDLGTNGEVILKCRNGIWATSCATGPALEGSHISCGMRASPGAITKIFIAPETFNVTVETYRAGKSDRPSGICGSGIIDGVSQMVKTGIVLSHGGFNKELPHDITAGMTKPDAFVIVPGSRTATGNDIAITLKDIREVQLAKAALAAGIQILMKTAGIAAVDKTFITGAFGNCFNIENALNIGMLPGGIHPGRIESVENLAGRGAVAALCDIKKRKHAFNLAKKIRFIDLAADKDFTDIFAAATCLKREYHAASID